MSHLQVDTIFDKIGKTAAIHSLSGRLAGAALSRGLSIYCITLRARKRNKRDGSLAITDMVFKFSHHRKTITIHT